MTAQSVILSSSNHTCDSLTLQSTTTISWQSSLESWRETRNLSDEELKDNRNIKTLNLFYSSCRKVQATIYNPTDIAAKAHRNKTRKIHKWIYKSKSNTHLWHDNYDMTWHSSDLIWCYLIIARCPCPHPPPHSPYSLLRHRPPYSCERETKEKYDSIRSEPCHVMS